MLSELLVLRTVEFLSQNSPLRASSLQNFTGLYSAGSRKRNRIDATKGYKRYKNPPGKGQSFFTSATVYIEGTFCVSLTSFLSRYFSYSLGEEQEASNKTALSSCSIQ